MVIGASTASPEWWRSPTEDDEQLLSDCVDDVESWMNENVADDGYHFEWSDGEFYYRGDAISESDAEDHFNEMLDECYQGWQFGQYSFRPSAIVSRCDPIMYREEFLNWCDAEGIEIA